VTSPAAKKKDAPPSRWRDHVEAAAMAIVVAVMLKYFVVEAYQIPSGSMQPTLMGSPEAGVFDRILVDKLSFHFRDPERWEVTVFKYPLDRSKSFIKRLVGMPGEDLRIARGDLWTRKDANDEWRVLRRPEPVQRECWKRIDTQDARYSEWKREAGAGAWAVHGRESFQARGSGTVRLPNDGGPVVDSYFDGYPDGMVEHLKASPRISRVIATRHNSVGDVRLSGEINAHANLKQVKLVLSEGPREYSFTLPGPASPASFDMWNAHVPAETKDSPAEPDAQVSLYAPPGGETPRDGQSFAWRLPAGKPVSFAVQNLDDVLRLDIDGEKVFEIEIPSAADQRCQFAIQVDGDADFSGLELERDIFYTEGLRMLSEFRIPAGHYVMLGDNTQDSSDSREWKTIDYKWSGRGSEGAWVSGNLREGNENPAMVNGTVFFRDVWGERHAFEQRGSTRGDDKPQPFVPRELITGRAVLVFWPMAPSLNVWRLQWIR
jgi:signal peptidase I